MKILFRVTNTPPDIARPDAVDPEHLAVFRRAMGSDASLPYTHQAACFHEVAAGRTVYMVAGTAAGKTLALGVPLFHRLQHGFIRKVVLLYPTLALLEDQMRVMQSLAAATGLAGQVGELRGGMTRSQVLHNLNRRIIVATPDEIYWFFRKSVKYSALLLYGLSQADDFLLDEAHVFNGLALQNFSHLWMRVHTLAQSYLSRTPRLHILTATPTPDLERLASEAPIEGRSKSDTVSVAFSIKAQGESVDQYRESIRAALAENRKKVLVVANSARTAHQLFEQCPPVRDGALTLEQRLRFGKVTVGKLLQAVGGASDWPGLARTLEARLIETQRVVLRDLSPGTRITLPGDVVWQEILAVLEVIGRQLHQSYTQDGYHHQPPGTHAHGHRALRHALSALGKDAGASDPSKDPSKEWEAWLEAISGCLPDAFDQSVPLTLPGYDALKQRLASAMPSPLAETVCRRLMDRVAVKQEWVSSKGYPVASLADRQVYLKWLPGYFEAEESERIKEMVASAVRRGDLHPECRYVRMWPGTVVPAIVYSGSMAKYGRKGLIALFGELPEAVLLTTPAAEVGVDFASDTLLTEECDGNALLQRIGRVGRHGEGQALVFVSGDVAHAWHDADGSSLSREAFGKRVHETFPPRRFARGSELLDAAHLLVNAQVGRIGEQLNQRPEMQAVRDLAEQLREVDLSLPYGLRGSLPGIALRDEGVAKDPFYALRYIGPDKLSLSGSPFELAQAQIYFTQFLYQPFQRTVSVDWEQSLRAARALLVWTEGKWKLFPGQALGQYMSNVKQAPNPGDRNLRRWRLLLLVGDLYLNWFHREDPKPEAVSDRQDNPLVLQDHGWLLLWGWGRQPAEDLLREAQVDQWEELHYDWDGADRPGSPGLILVDRATGACAAAYRKLYDHVADR